MQSVQFYSTCPTQSDSAFFSNELLELNESNEDDQFLDVNKVEQILERIEQINNEIKRRTNSLERLRRSNSLRNKERSSIAPVKVSNVKLNNNVNDVSLGHRPPNESCSRNFCRSTNQTTNILNHLTTSDKQVDYLVGDQSIFSTSEMTSDQPSWSKCKNNNFIKLRQITEKLAKTNSAISSFDSLNCLSNLDPVICPTPSSTSPRLGISSLKSEISKIERQVKMFNRKNDEMTLKFKNEGKLTKSSERNEMKRTKLNSTDRNMVDKQSNQLSGELSNQSGSGDKLSDRHCRLKDERDSSLFRFKSLPQLDLERKLMCLSNDDLSNLTKFNSPTTPTKNCLSLPRSFGLNARKLVNRSDSSIKRESFHSKTNKFKSFFKTKLNSPYKGNLVCSTPKRLYRQESFLLSDPTEPTVKTNSKCKSADNESVIKSHANDRTKNVMNDANMKDLNVKDLSAKDVKSDASNKDIVNKVINDKKDVNRADKCNSFRFNRKISQILNKHYDESDLSNYIVKTELTDIDNSIDSIEHNVNSADCSPLINRNDKFKLTNQRATGKLKSKFPTFLNGNRISRNSCQSSFSSADSGHTSVPSTSSFSSSNLARSLSFNETPTPDLIITSYARMNKLKSNETNGSLSSNSSTTNTDSLINYNKSNLIIDETFCHSNDVELKIFQLLVQATVCLILLINFFFALIPMISMTYLCAT